MSLNLDTGGWRRVRLGDVIRRSRKQVDPLEAGIERYVAGGDIDGDSVSIERWSDVNDGQMGSTFRYVFEPGQILFVSARPYLRKSGVVGFSGVVADKTYVLDAIPENGLLQEFLPFVLSSDPFIDYATAEATGSMNPRLLWGQLQGYELDVPPLDEQKRIADLLWAVEATLRAQSVMRDSTADTKRAWLDEQISRLMRQEIVPFARVWSRSPESGWSSVPVPEDTGHYVLSLAALGPEGYRPGNLKRIADTSEARAATLRRGDLLVSRANTADAVGRVCIFPEERLDTSFPDTMMRVSLTEDVMPEFAAAVLASAHGRAHMRRHAAGSATSMVKINRASLGRLDFPVASIEKQRDLLSDLERLTRGIAALADELSQLSTLRRAVMTEVFGGN